MASVCRYRFYVTPFHIYLALFPLFHWHRALNVQPHSTFFYSPNDYQPLDHLPFAISFLFSLSKIIFDPVYLFIVVICLKKKKKKNTNLSPHSTIHCHSLYLSYSFSYIYLMKILATLLNVFFFLFFFILTLPLILSRCQTLLISNFFLS